jgi:L-2-hydroxyglutarate oxidase LhgO
LSVHSAVVIGAGIVGLAVARRLLQVMPGADVTVLDKETEVGMHQTSHNSGVVHAGVYYVPGSLKALLCARGRELLKDFCFEWSLPYVECGKIVIAKNGLEVPRLNELALRAEANNVPGARLLNADELKEVEPYACGVAALHSPHTAIVDFGSIAKAMATDLGCKGGKLVLSAAVTGFSRERQGVRVLSTAGELSAERVIICAGLQSDRIAVLAGDARSPAIVPFRGEYYRLAKKSKVLVKGLIYPVPDPRYPFLGVHFTRRVGGDVDIGPNAVLALAREGYCRRDVNLADILDMMRDPSFYKMARSHWRAGVKETVGSVSRSVFVNAARQYVPSLSHNDVEPAPAGVRAQAVAQDGSLLDDFAIHYLGNVIALRNAPSPGATSSLAIAEHLVSRLTADSE